MTCRDDSVHIHNLLTWKEDVWRINQKVHISDVAFSGNSEFLYVLCSVLEENILYTIQISHHMNLICHFSIMNVICRHFHDRHHSPGSRTTEWTDTSIADLC